jgi:hypothetical protein
VSLFLALSYAFPIVVGIFLTKLPPFGEHKRIVELCQELAVAHVDGSIGRVLVKLSRVDVLALDDFAMAPLIDSERRDVLEICD